MKMAIMQPYFFPYVGYYQLIKLADKFVILDDVNFINKGWINRNNILINGHAGLVTIPLVNASQNKLIRDIPIALDDKYLVKLLRTIEYSYRKAPYFAKVFPILEGALLYKADSISSYNLKSIEDVCSYLRIETEIVQTSVLYNNADKKGQERILDICVKECADHYVNLSGGVNLYSGNLFKERGIELQFIKSDTIKYKQFSNTFVPQLSIIDLMMFNSEIEIDYFLSQYQYI